MTVSNCNSFTCMEPITKGWSKDKKYRVTKADGSHYLLRISPASCYESRKLLSDMLTKVSALGVPICLPVEIGNCDDGVYTLHSWIDGEDLEAVLPMLSETEQYVLGRRSGEILRQIHEIPAPPDVEEWEGRFHKKIDRNIQLYCDCSIKFDGAECLLAYINDNRHLLADRPQCFQHGDYHIGNMMLENGALVIIDFDRFDFGDPWEEFNRITWCAQASPHFATGMVDGYFDGKPPIAFWQLLALYISSNMLSSVPWAIPFGQAEVDTMLRQAKDVLSWYDNMKNPVPAWYIPNFYFQLIDGLPCKLKAPFDFSFLSKYGKVFKVFDDQDSGNLCFGVEKEGRRYFVKFAGAPTVRATQSPTDAAAALRACVPVYQALAHTALINLVKSEEVGGGYAMLFDWADGDCAARMYPQEHKRFQALPIEDKLHTFDAILAFHAFAAEKGYVAIDFYDGSILYDTSAQKTTICDIDFYAKQPYINEMGRLWGSSRFMSPEEFEKGAIIDEISNVYTMGATAFALLANYDRSRDAWTLGDKLYAVVKNAISDERSKRQQSLRQLLEEWEAAKK